MKINFFQLIPNLEVRRRVEFLQQSEVRSEIGAISAGIIDFVDRVFRYTFRSKNVNGNLFSKIAAERRWVGHF